MSSTPSPQDVMQLLIRLDFDVDAGIEFCGGDADFYCDLIRELQADVLPQRHEALEQGNPQRRREYSHLLKGTLQTLGEKRASLCAREVERALRNGEPDTELTLSLRNELERIHAALDELFGQSSSNA